MPLGKWICDHSAVAGSPHSDQPGLKLEVVGSVDAERVLPEWGHAVDNENIQQEREPWRA